MKKIVTLVCLSICLSLFISQSHAQFSKADKKEWKSKAKEYKKNPEQLKKLMDEHNSLKSQVSSLDGQVKTLQARLDEKNSKISELGDQNENLKAELAAARQKLKEKKAQKKASPDFEKGLVFKVQIGAFLNRDLTQYGESQENFDAETDEKGIHKYTIGTFRDYWEADKFKKYLRAMGVKDAWIISYQDGNRVPIKEVLEGIIQSGS